MDNRVYFPDTFKTYEFAVDCYRLAKYLNANKIEFYVGNFSCDYDKDYDTIFFTNADFQGKYDNLNTIYEIQKVINKILKLENCSNDKVLSCNYYNFNIDDYPIDDNSIDFVDLMTSQEE